MYKRLTVGVMFVLALMCYIVPVASAHAELVSSDPAAGSTVSTAPKQMKLVFSEALKESSTVDVLDASGKPVDASGKLDLNDLDHKTYIVTLPTLSSGTYTVKWTSVSDDDGDSESGTFNFTVAGAAQPTSATQPTSAATSVSQPTSAAQPTSMPASTAQPTAVAAGLPNTGAPESNGYALLLIVVACAGGIGWLLRRATKQS